MKAIFGNFRVGREQWKEGIRFKCLPIMGSIVESRKIDQWEKT